MGLSEICERIKRPRKNLMDTDNSVVIARGRGGEVGEIEKGKGVNGDGKRLDFGW